jgi:hypothetical protein
MTLLQKAVSPRLSRAYLNEGYDRVGGHVVRVADVRFARSITDLAAVHGLHAPGSGWTADAGWVDLLRFDTTWAMRYLGEPGFAVPLWWLLPTRVPPGAQLVRRYADGGLELLARYGHVGTGWMPTDRERPAPVMAPLSVCAGPVVRWRGTHIEADLVDGYVIVATSTEPDLTQGFWPGAPGRWYRQVDPSEIDDVLVLDVTATWRGLRVRVVDQVLRDGRQVAHIVPAADDVDAARGRGMRALDADVLDAWVDLDELAVLRSQRLEAPAGAHWQPPAPAHDDTPLPGPELGAEPGAEGATDPSTGTTG